MYFDCLLKHFPSQRAIWGYYSIRRDLSLCRRNDATFQVCVFHILGHRSVNLTIFCSKRVLMRTLSVRNSCPLWANKTKMGFPRIVDMMCPKVFGPLRLMRRIRLRGGPNGPNRLSVKGCRYFLLSRSVKSFD